MMNATIGNIKTLNGNELFNTSGRLKGGNEAVHKFFRITIGTNHHSQEQTELPDCRMKKEKRTSLFKATFNKLYSRNRKHKQKEGNQGQKNPLRSKL